MKSERRAEIPYSLSVSLGDDETVYLLEANLNVQSIVLHLDKNLHLEVEMVKLFHVN